MYIIKKLTTEHIAVHVREVDNNDFKQITIKRYLFNWKKLRDTCKIYKLTQIDSEDILGLIALIDFPEEERTEIKLLTVSIENIGKQKQFDRIAGCLIAFAAREAVRKFKKFPALSLIPKTELKQHYISKYNMADAGWQLYLEDIPIVECY
jgi:DTW domain-containing protein YfiP